MAAAKKAIKKLGEIVTDRYGRPKVNPPCDLERWAKAQFLAVLRQLGLDNQQHIRIRERRNGARATYT